MTHEKYSAVTALYRWAPLFISLFACAPNIGCNRSKKIASVPTPPTHIESPSTVVVPIVTPLAILTTSTPIMVSKQPATQPAHHVAIGMDGRGDVHAVWQDHCMQAGIEHCPFGNVATSSASTTPASTTSDAITTLPPDIVYRRIPAPAILISTGDANQRHDGASSSPALAVAADGTAHIVWTESGNVTSSADCPNKRCAPRIVYRSISPAGKLSPLVWVSNVPASGRSDFAAIGIASRGRGAIYIVWFSSDATHGGALYFRRVTSGHRWSEPTLISRVHAPRTFPKVAVDNDGNGHVVWHDEVKSDTHIFYAALTSSHSKRGNPSPPAITPVLVSDNPRFYNARNPDIAIANGTALIVWKDQGTYQESDAAQCTPPHCDSEIILTARTINGKGEGAWLMYTTGSASIRRFDRVSARKYQPTKDALQPTIAAYGNHFGIAWRDTSSPTDDIAVRLGTIPTDASSNATLHVFDPQRLVPHAGTSHSPRLTLDAHGVPHVAWVEGTADSAHIQLARGMPNPR